MSAWAPMFKLRQLAKRIPPLYWLVGVVRHSNHQRKLRAETKAYAATHGELVPPPALRFRVHGAMQEDVYVEAGRVIAREIDAAWRRHGTLPPDDVLDFGCGPGRIAVQFKTLFPDCRLSGTDIDPESISWANAHLSNVGAFETNSPDPPLPYSEGSFDFVYTVSVFTHLEEDGQFRWLEELARVLRPGGILVATVHGALARGSCTSKESRDLEAKGFVYRVDRKGSLKLDGLPDTYQTTFHSRAYVERHWQADFELLEYVEGGIAGHQDLVILSRSIT